MTYVDRPETGSMSGCHVLVESLYSLRSRHLSILLVHVVCTRARVISDPDTEVLDLLRALFVDLTIPVLISQTYTSVCRSASSSAKALLRLPKHVITRDVKTYHVKTDDLAVRFLDLS